MADAPKHALKRAFVRVRECSFVHTPICFGKLLRVVTAACSCCLTHCALPVASLALIGPHRPSLARLTEHGPVSTYVRDCHAGPVRVSQSRSARRQITAQMALTPRRALGHGPLRLAGRAGFLYLYSRGDRGGRGVSGADFRR